MSDTTKFCVNKEVIQKLAQQGRIARTTHAKEQAVERELQWNLIDERIKSGGFRVLDHAKATDDRSLDGNTWRLIIQVGTKDVILVVCVVTDFKDNDPSLLFITIMVDGVYQLTEPLTAPVAEMIPVKPIFPKEKRVVNVETCRGCGSGLDAVEFLVKAMDESLWCAGCIGKYKAVYRTYGGMLLRSVTIDGVQHDFGLKTLFLEVVRGRSAA